MQRRILGISFDALGTLVRLRGGSVGAAYTAGVRDYERVTGLSPGVIALPDEPVIEAQFRQAYKRRALDAKAQRGAHGVVGGACPATRDKFWYDVVAESLSLSSGQHARDEPGLRHAVVHVVEFFRTTGGFELLSDARSALDLARHIVGPPPGCVAVATNNDDRMRDALAAHGVLKHAVPPGPIDLVVTSFDAQQKPSPEGLLRALGLSCRDEAARRERDEGVIFVHVGDSDDDTAAAAAAGIRCLLCDPCRGVSADDLRRFCAQVVLPNGGCSGR